jgi:hypothetical protein
MTVELWYGHRPTEPAEQAVLTDLYDYLRAQPEHFVLLTSFHAGVSHEIDLVILKNTGWFVTEIKHVQHKVVGGVSGEWKCFEPDGSVKSLRNPFLQVRGSYAGFRNWCQNNLKEIRLHAPPPVIKFYEYVVLHPRIPAASEIDLGDSSVQVIDLPRLRTMLQINASKDMSFTVGELQTIPRLLKLTHWQLDPAQTTTVESTEPDAPRIQPGPVEAQPAARPDDSRITQTFPGDYRSPPVRMLVPREPEPLQRVFYITKSPITIGREQDCDLFINHNSISRKHAEIRWDKDRWIVRDFGSRNGVFVAYNGDPSTERRVERFNAIKNGSIVRFGQVSFTFLLNEGK